ncbi:MAG: aldo/keto reductase [Steroidobacteraceae bacterium]
MNAATPFPARIGLGTWKMGEGDRRDLPAIRHALEHGYRLIDTAEMYAQGGAERVIGKALLAHGLQHRPRLCIVSKVLPDNASRHGTVRACEASLERLGCGYLDVYLLHWPGRHPLAQTLEAFVELRERGLIRHFGVSNLDAGELQQWRAAERTLGITDGACTNQVYYCMAQRGIEFAQLAWQRAHGFCTMAYSPLGQGDLLRDPMVKQLAADLKLTPAQLALAWVLRHPEMVAIPKSSDPQRIEQNLRAADVTLDAATLARIDARFPPPRAELPLATS